MDTKNLSYTSVEQIYSAINKIISLKASNISLIADGNQPENPISDQLWNEVLKILDKIHNFDTFNKLANGISVPVKTKKEKDVETPETEPEQNTGNPFEARSKVVKEKLNGATNK